MCGIAGYVSFDSSEVDTQLLESMKSALSHRGPDDSAIWTEGAIGFAHTRLAIIDLEHGKQPFQSSDGNYVLSYNGEIYNFRELRSKLEAEGVSFRTHSDTEVLLNAWIKWGDSCLNRLRGMFAFAIYDRRNHKVFLARDHFGMKPLVYTHNSTFFAFSSEIQALRTIPQLSLSIRTDSVAEYLQFRYISAPSTIFNEVLKLPPASLLEVCLETGRSSLSNYWKPEFQEDSALSKQDALDRFQSVFQQVVTRHLVSDVPFGVFLSGGLDSTAITKAVSTSLGEAPKSFSITFDESDYDESAYIELASKAYQTKHQSRIVELDALSPLPKLLQHFGEPFADWSAIPLYHLSQMAQTEVPMVISGDGGDELLGGYLHHVEWMKLLSPKLNLKNTLRFLKYVLFGSPWGFSHWRNLNCYMNTELTKKLLRSELQNTTQLEVPHLSSEYERADSLSALRQAQLMDYAHFLPSDILTKADICSMMHGLEVRTPFIDVDLFEVVAAFPTKYLADLEDEHFTSKKPLRSYLKSDFPKEFLDRPKMGFNLPLNEWFSSGMPLRSKFEEQLNSSPRLFAYLEESEVENMLNSHGSKHQLGPQLWILHCLEEWLQLQ